MRAVESRPPPTLAAPASRPPSWRERWLAWRDRQLTSAQFQQRAQRLWFLRPIVRRRARGLFDLVSGFVYSQVLLACVRVRAFEVLAEGPQSTVALAQRFALPLEATERLLMAAASLGLVEHRRGGRWGLGVLGAPLVGNQALLAMIEHHTLLYADLQDPLALLRGEGDAPALSRYWAYAEAAAPEQLQRADVDAYSTLMSASQPLVAQQVLDAYPLHDHRCLLDVGGGQGRFLDGGRTTPPRTAAEALRPAGRGGAGHRQLCRLRLGERAEVHGGDFQRDALPGGADIASLVRVIYDHDDAAALAILRAVHRALPPGGTLLLAEPMAGAPGAPRMGDAYFGMYLLAMRGGRARSAAELTALLHQAGFAQVRERATPIPLQVGVIVCRRAGVNTS